MNRALGITWAGGMLASITLNHVATGVSILAGLAGFIAAVPVIIDRWRHLLPACITRHFPAKP